MVREAAGRKRRVTLKIRIQREANLAKLLDHPNLVKLRDFRTSTSHFYLFFDYVQGVQLAECIPTHGMSESRATKYLAQLVDALAYCHRHSVVHRDIKIENIMVDGNDRIKLIDFGLANFYDPSSHLNTSCGTIPYTAPEILRGDKYIGPEIDIWSLGVVLFTMLTGSLPFGDPRIHNNYWTIMNSQVNYPPTMSKLAHDCITKCLIPNRKLRIDTYHLQQHTLVKKGYNMLVLEEAGKGGSFYADREKIDPSTQGKMRLPRVLNDQVLENMQACLFLPTDVIKQQLISEIQKGDPDDKDHVLCKTTPLVAVYYLVAHSVQKQTQVQRSQSGEFQSMFQFNGSGTLAANDIDRLTLEPELHEGLQALLSPTVPHHDLRPMSPSIALNSRLSNQGIQIPKSNSNGPYDGQMPIGSPSQGQMPSIAQQTSAQFPFMQPHRDYRKITLAQSLQENPVILSKLTPHQLEKELEVALQKVGLPYIRTHANESTKFLCQYSPSLNQNQEEDLLDKLSCTVELEVVRFRTKSALMITLVSGGHDRLEDMTHLLRAMLMDTAGLPGSPIY